MDIQKIQKYEEQIIRWRREFHAHPELSFQEIRTSGRIQEELKRLQIPFDLVASTQSRDEMFGAPPEAAGQPLGIVARLEGTGPGNKRLALRADMDALPVQEETGAPYASTIPGKMHACGHDAHIAMLLGAAAFLAEHRDAFGGTVYLCFQCAEEISAGAQEILRYLAGRGGVTAVGGLHVWGTLPAGKILLRAGPVLAGLFSFTVTVTGKGGHGSRPDLVQDPIKPAADLILKLSSIPSNFYDVLDHAAVHLCMVQSGTAFNIFPDTARVLGGVRFFKPEGSANLLSTIRRIAAGVAEAYDVDIRVAPSPVLSPVVNDAGCVRQARQALAGMEGLAAVDGDPLSASDNYSEFLQAYPGFYGMLGAGNEAWGLMWNQHNCHFDIDESVLVKGAEFLCRWVLA